MRKLIFGTLIAFIVVAGAFLVERSYRLNRAIPSGGGAHMASAEALQDLRLRNYATKEILTIDHFKDKVLLINFWASWCAACLQEMPSIVSLREKMKGKPFEVLLINVDDEPEKLVPKLAEKLKITFPIYTDVDGNLTNYFEISAIPFSAVIKKGSALAWSEAGERDWASDEVLEESERLF